MGRKVKITNSSTILLNNLIPMIEQKMGVEDYLITEQTVADKYGKSVDEIIQLEKEAIPFELDEEKNPKIRRARILKNLKSNIDFYKENDGKLNSNFTDAIIVNEKGQILFGLRNKSDNIEPNKWCLLGGGHQERFLSPERNVKKEIKEETNLDVLDCSPIYEKRINSGKNKIIYFYCTLPKNYEVTINEREHQNYKWMSLKDIENTPKEDFIFDLKEILLKDILKIK